MNKRRAVILLSLMMIIVAACSGSGELVSQRLYESEQDQSEQFSIEANIEEAMEEPAAELETVVEGEPVEVTRVVADGAVVMATRTGPQFQNATPMPMATATIAAESPTDNFFETYGVNPYVATVEDHLSTFGLDVDTASYTVARRYIREGHLPPPDAIRVEEFVNYFDQEYAVPPNVAFAIYADGAPSPFHSDGTHIIRFGIQGYEVIESERQTASLTFVIDVSGSMDRGNRLDLVKYSLEKLVARLRPDDMVSIVVYGSSARVVLEPTSGQDKGTILNAIYSLRPEGSTNAEAGIRLGYQMANAAYRPGGINRVILASDGVANVGVTDPDVLANQIRNYADGGITLTTVGFGMGNFNDVLMEQLADQGDGQYAYVDTPAEAEKLFVEDLTSTLQAIAMDAKVQVDFNPAVVSYYRLIGYENRAIADQDFRNDTVDAGEIGAGHTVTALYAVQMIPGVEGRLATVQMRWEDPETHQVQEINGNFNTWDLAPSFDSASPRYQLAVVVGQYAELLRNSYWAGDTTYNQLGAYAQRLASIMSTDQDVIELVGLITTAGQLRH